MACVAPRTEGGGAVLKAELCRRGVRASGDDCSIGAKIQCLCGHALVLGLLRVPLPLEPAGPSAILLLPLAGGAAGSARVRNTETVRLHAVVFALGRDRAPTGGREAGMGEVGGEYLPEISAVGFARCVCYKSAVSHQADASRFL